MSKYLALAEEGLVDKLECPMDQGLLMCNQSSDEELFLYCLSCEYRKIIGLGYYQDLLKIVEINERREFKRDGSIDYEVKQWNQTN